MKNKFLEILDGTKQPPRDIQIHYFTHLRQQMAKYRIHGMSGPPGIGKSFIARTIQRTCPNTSIITPNNLLVDQYTETYPELNSVKGKDYYDTIGAYYAAHAAAKEGAPSIFNPLSFYYFHVRYPKVGKPSVVVIDEAHSLLDMLLLTINRSFSCKYYGIPQELSDVEFLEWLKNRVEKLSPIYNNPKARSKIAERLAGHFESFHILYEYLRDNLHKVKIFYEEKEDSKGRLRPYLTVQPLTAPVGLLKTIFGGARLILLSGSITSFHLEEMFPEESHIDFINYEPLAPKENRPIFYAPVSQQNRTDPEVLAKEILKIYRQENMINTVVHVSYQAAKILAPLLKEIKPIVHDKSDKHAKLQEFKYRGGLLLASGMAEGVDLPGDLCRLIIIPRLLFPNLGDQAVQKRLALPQGQLWYDLATMMITVQQIGRGVRSATDSCKTYILDPLFPRIINKTEKHLTQGFKQSIHWHKG
jgi:Rad3-related DNA helicase